MIIIICGRLGWFGMPLEQLECIGDAFGMPWMVLAWDGLALCGYWLNWVLEDLLSSGCLAQHVCMSCASRCRPAGVGGVLFWVGASAPYPSTADDFVS